MINLNEMAEEISRREGKAKQVNIAQIKEILKICLVLLCEEEMKRNGSVVELLEKYKDEAVIHSESETNA